MSKVTDRLDNKQIIDLARKQYEQRQKTNKYPGHIVKLPSAGKVYPESSPLREGVVELRLMTAYDEDIITNSSYINTGIVFDKLLEALIITPGVDVNDLINSDKESLIISARILGYGPDYPAFVVNNGQTEKHTLNLSKIQFKPFELQSDENGEFDYQIEDGTTLKFKYLTAEQSKNLSDVTMISDFLKGCITAVNGIRDSKEIDNFLAYSFRAKESKEFRKYVIDNTPGIDYNIEVEGEDGSTFIAGFRIESDLFWF
jgi:hypothetical protein